MADDSPITPPAAPPLAPPLPRPPDSAPPDLLLTYLASRDHPCPGCGYNLRALTSTRCPECNQQLTLNVGLAEPRMAAYLAALAAPLAGAGMAALFLFFVVYMTLRYRGGPRGREFWVIYGIPPIALITQGVLLILLAQRRGRVWFRSLTPGAKAATIVACWVVPIGFITWLIHSVR